MHIQHNSKMYFFAAAFLAAMALTLWISGVDIRISVTLILAGGAFLVLALKNRRREKDEGNDSL